MGGAGKQIDGEDSGAAPGLTKGRSLAFGREFGAMQEKAGDRIGPYQLLEVLGEGGFGVVWKAERHEPHRQVVALKTIKPGMDSKAVVARFEQERQALACMEHPNIARVFDGGLTPAGRPYFVMELVRGEPLTVFCDRKKLTIRERLELFVPVCEAVQHAHAKGVAHRDLKPSNILVTEASGQGIPKIIDFGIAKVMLGPLSEATLHTALDMWIGTLAYMSPEQAGLGGQDVDLRTDVYSLGVVLYEMLAGVLPFDPSELYRAARREAQRIICEEEPPSPSTRLSKITGTAPKDGAGTSEDTTRIAHARGTEAPALLRMLRRELEWVPLKAMRKERDRRYQSAQELADDIRRYLKDEPLKAGPESLSYRAAKLVRRRRGAFLAGGVAGLGLLVGGVAVANARQERAVAGVREAEAAKQLELKKTEAEQLEVVVNTALDGLNPAARDMSLGEEAPLVMIRTLLDSGCIRQYPELELRLRARLGDSLSSGASPELAIDEYRRVLASLQAAGAPRLEIIEARINLGVTLANTGAIEELQAMIEPLRAELAAESAASHATLSRFHSLDADALQLAKKPAEALAPARLAVEEAEKADQPRLLIASLRGLARQTGVDGTGLDEAIRHLERCAALAHEHIPGDAVEQVSIVGELAPALVRTGNPARAQQVIDGAMPVAATLDPSHPSVLTMRMFLPRALLDQEKFLEAACAAYSLAQSAGATENPRVIAIGEMMFGMACRELGRYDESAAALRRAINAADTAEDDATGAMCRMHLAEALARSGLASGSDEVARRAADEAEALARSAGEMLAASPFAQTEQKLEAANVLGGILAMRGKADEAAGVMAGAESLGEFRAFARWRKRAVAERMIRVAKARGDVESEARWQRIAQEWATRVSDPKENR